MSSETLSSKQQPAKVEVKLVTLNKGFQLAESWVGSMSGSAIDESNEVEFEGRQPRLGLGAKATSQSIAGNSVDPVERRILTKINAQKKSAARSVEESNPSKKNVGPEEDEEDSDDDSESRAKAFTKKRVGALNPLQASKKKK